MQTQLPYLTTATATIAVLLAASHLNEYAFDFYVILDQRSHFSFCVSSNQRCLQCVGFRGRVLSAGLHL